MNEIVPRYGESTGVTPHDRTVGRIRKEVVHNVQRELGRGLVASARLEARAYAARTALINAALLSQEEEALIRVAPLGEARYKAIVDAYAVYAAREVSGR